MFSWVHTMPPAVAAEILRALQKKHVEVYVGGGWAVDALLQRNTREHDDLDLWLPIGSAEGCFAVMAEIGLDRIFPWPGDRPWNFVLHDGGARRVDLHFFERLSDGRVHYGSVREGEVLPSEAFAGTGSITDLVVRCESPAWAVKFHEGYPPRPKDRHDVTLLCELFGIDIPSTLRSESKP